MDFLLGVMMAVGVWSLIKVFESFDKLDKLIDEVKKDQEILTTERDYYKAELEKREKWAVFLPGQDSRPVPSEVTPPQRDPENPKEKYDPEKISGMFDTLYKENDE